MDFDSLQQAWAGQPATPTTDTVWEEARRRAGVLDRRTRIRDLVELATAVGLAALFVWIATLSPVKWPWIAAALVVAGVGAIFVRERMRSVATPPAPSDVRQSLERAIVECDHQIRLLGSVATWYLAPLGVAIVLVFVGVTLGIRAEVGPEVWARGRMGFLGAIGGASLLCAALFVGVWWLNQWAVSRHLRPHRDHLVTALQQLDSAEAEEDL
jgi:hypothetical protein